jgi:hypothetical protein
VQVRIKNPLGDQDIQLAIEAKPTGSAMVTAIDQIQLVPRRNSTLHFVPDAEIVLVAGGTLSFDRSIRNPLEMVTYRAIGGTFEGCVLQLFLGFPSSGKGQRHVEVMWVNVDGLEPAGRRPWSELLSFQALNLWSKNDTVINGRMRGRDFIISKEGDSLRLDTGIAGAALVADPLGRANTHLLYLNPDEVFAVDLAETFGRMAYYAPEMVVPVEHSMGSSGETYLVPLPSDDSLGFQVKGGRTFGLAKSGGNGGTKSWAPLPANHFFDETTEGRSDSF